MSLAWVPFADVLKPTGGRVRLTRRQARQPSLQIMASKGVCNVIKPANSEASNDTDVAGDRTAPDAASRALAEAEGRRVAEKTGRPLPKEINGRQGPEPVRYGDWENKGIASDF